MLYEYRVRYHTILLQKKAEHSALLLQTVKGMVRNDYDDSFDFEEFEEFGDCENFRCSNEEERGYEWTEEDAWDALTDGMYGDMPGDPLQYDAMWDAMGF